MKKLMVAMVAAMAAAVSLATGVSISYQGQLRDGKGEKLTVTQGLPVAFRLYDQATGGTALWGRKYAVTLDEEGYFNVELSDSTGSIADPKIDTKLEKLLADKAQSSTLFVGLEVEGSTGEIAPRQKLLSVPVAAFAQNVQNASGDFTVNGTARVNGGLTVKGKLVANGEFEAADAKVTGAFSLSGSGRFLTSQGVDIVPSGVIVMWSGSVADIPRGWVLCDGKNKTPDLRDRFIVGAGLNYAVKATGGEAKHALSEAEMPKHSHSYDFTGADLAASWDSDNYFYCQKDYYSGNKNTRWTNAAGGNSSGKTEAHENRPPYFALCFIMKQ